MPLKDLFTVPWQNSDFSGLRVYKDLTLLNKRDWASASSILFTHKTQPDFAHTPALILISVADNYKRSNKQILASGRREPVPAFVTPSFRWMFYFTVGTGLMYTYTISHSISPDRL